MAKPLTPAEKLAGRRRPREATYRDILLSRFLDAEGKPVGKANPAGAYEKHLLAPFKQLQRERLIEMGLRISFGGRLGKNDGIWYLRKGDEPLAQARAARERVEAARTALAAWGDDFKAGYRREREMRGLQGAEPSVGVTPVAAVAPVEPVVSAEEPADDFDL